MNFPEFSCLPNLGVKSIIMVNQYKKYDNGRDNKKNKIGLETRIKRQMMKKIFCLMFICAVFFSGCGSDSGDDDSGSIITTSIQSSETSTSSVTTTTTAEADSSSTTTTTSGGSINCQGCCSGHGGVICSSGVTRCGDGTSLSDTCRNKGCDACL